MPPCVSNDKTAPGGREPRVIRWAEMTWTDFARVGLGIAAFVTGILGLVLPILQGVLFLIVAAILLAPYSRWVQKKLAWFEARFPWLAKKARGVTGRWHRKTDNGHAGRDD